MVKVVSNEKLTRSIVIVLAVAMVLTVALTAFAASAEFYEIIGLSDEVYTKTTIQKPTSSYKFNTKNVRVISICGDAMPPTPNAS